VVVKGGRKVIQLLKDVYYQQPGGGLVVKGRKVVQLLNVFSSNQQTRWWLKEAGRSFSY
jgi:hypothetical protein